MFTCVNVRAECTGAAQSVLVLFFPFFADGDCVCHKSLAPLARSPTLRDCDTHLPVRITIPQERRSRIPSSVSSPRCALDWPCVVAIRTGQSTKEPPLLFCGRATFLGSLSLASLRESANVCSADRESHKDSVDTDSFT